MNQRLLPARRHPRRAGSARAGAVRLTALVTVLAVAVVAPGGPTQWDATPALAQQATPEGPRGDGEEPPSDPLEAARPAIRTEIRRLDTMVRGAVERRQEADEALAEAVELTSELEGLRADALPVATAAADTADTAATTARQLAVNATRRLGEARQRLTDAALGLYMSGPIEQLDLASDDPLNRFRTSQSVRTGITELRTRVAAAHQDVTDSRAEADSAAAAARDARTELEAVQQDAADLAERIAALVASAERANQAADNVRGAASSAQASILGMLAGVGAPTDRAVDPSVAILGEPVLTAAQLVSWFASQSDPGGVEELAALFIAEGRELGVRGDIAFIQAVLETGGFQFTGSYNYAGIGHCDSCPRGYAFPSARDGVRAQLQLLRAYADPDVTAGDLPGGPVPPINVASLGVRGCCASWWGLSGVWASGLHYGGTVLMMYESALAHAQAG